MRISSHLIGPLARIRRRLRCGCLLVVLAGFLGLAAPVWAAPFVYVTEELPGPAGLATAFDATSGQLLPLPRSPGTGDNPLAVAVSPDGTSVYVVNSPVDSSRGSLSQYDVAADGTLTPKAAAPVATGIEPNAIAVNPDGKAAYVTNFTDGSVSQYDVGPGGVLSPTIPPTVATVGDPHGVAVSPDGKSVYVTDGAGVSQYTVGAGDTLIAKKPASVAAGNGPEQVAVSPDGKSAYVTNFDGTVSQYTIGANGALHPRTPAAVATGNDPVGIAVSPDSGSVYVADHGDGLIAQFAATPKGLVLKTPETIAAGVGPLNLVVSPDGKRVYAEDNLGATLLQYSGGNGAGTLSPLTTPAFLSFGFPVGLSGMAIGPAQIRFRCGGVIEFCNVGILPVSSGGSTTAVVIRTTVVRAAPLGILVQRIDGNRRVTVGHVPFGLKRTGRLKIRWNLTVNGRQLRAGRYLITLRMFDRKGHLIGLAHPLPITVS